MKDPLQVFYPPRLGNIWVLPSLCQLPVSCWISTEDLHGSPGLPLWASSNPEFPLESDLIVCETSSLGICELSSPSFMDVEFPSDEAILEAMILDFRPLPELKLYKLITKKSLGLGLAMGPTWRTTMHKSKVVQSSVHIVLLCFLVFKFVSLNTCFIRGFYIRLINFWVSVFGLIYRTLETFYLVCFFMSIRSDRS
jgi:hypothetical protein